MAQTGLDEYTIILVWVVAGLVTLCGAFTVSGLSTLTEDSGGLYEYFRIVYGNFPAFLIGWTFSMIINPSAGAAISFLFSDAVNSIIPISNPFPSLEDYQLIGIYPFQNFGTKLVGIVSILFLTIINMAGSRESGTINNIATGAKVIGIGGLIVVGLLYTHPTGMDEAAQVTASSENASYLSLFFTAMLGAFWAYDGWAISPNIAGEMTHPKRDLTKVLTFGIIAVILIYTAINYSYMNVIPLGQFRAMGENQIGALVVAETMLGNFGKVLFQILLVVSTLSCLNANIVAAPRQYFRMAEEGWLFKPLAKVHQKFRTPVVSLMAFSGLTIVYLVSGTFDTLTNMLIFVEFLFFTLTGFAIFKLIRSGNPVKVIGYPFTPIILILFSLGLCINTLWVMPTLSLIGIVAVTIGIPFYYYFKTKRRS